MTRGAVVVRLPAPVSGCASERAFREAQRRLVAWLAEQYEPRTSLDMTASGLTPAQVRLALVSLESIGAVGRVGRHGNAILWVGLCDEVAP